MSALVAHLRDEPDRADEHFTTALELASEPPELAVVAFHRALVAGSRGDVQAAARQAGECAELGRQLASPLYPPLSGIIAGWASAMDGDPSGVERADAAHAEYLATGTRVYSTALLTLRAEAHARHGDPSGARALVREAVLFARDTGERQTGTRLIRVAQDISGTPPAN